MLAGCLREFELDDAAAPEPGSVLDALRPAFAVADGQGNRTLRRVWLDTFDWRLHRAGLVLEHVSARGRSEMTLTSQGGERIAVQQGRVRWPGLPDALPPGPVRDRLGQVAGLRALAPVVSAVSVVHDLRLLNGDEKTVVHVTLDHASVTAPVTATLAPRLAVTAVRGYQAQADRVSKMLAGVPGVLPSPRSEFEAALAAAGRRPGDYTNKIDVRLPAAMSAPDAVATVLLRLLDTMEANVSGVLRDIDTEFLHDLRVSVRRTRSALKLAGDVLPGDVADRFGPAFKWLGDLTTPVRDLDVYLLGFDGMTASLVAAVPEDLQPFRAHLARQRAAEYRRLVRSLRSAKFRGLLEDWRTALTKLTDARPARGAASRRAPRAPRSTAGDAMPAAEFAAALIRRAHRRVVRRGSAITPDSPPERLHDLRKRCKELRYLIEFFASLQDPAANRQAVQELRRLQDCLGEFQDSEVQLAAVRAFAVQMMSEQAAPALTLLAMGELAAQYGASQRRARGEFAQRFREFTSPRSIQGIGLLTMAAAA
jgi:CHAD domain-containing protein